MAPLTSNLTYKLSLKKIMFNLRNNSKILPKLVQYQQASTSPPQNVISSVFTNRNPRNLEKIRIGYKPDGYHVDKPGKCYWHKLNLTASGRYVTATVNHFENGEVIKASTSEWAIKKQLYRALDTSAYINLGRVLADRCLQSGILEVSCNIEPPVPNGKVALFLKAVENGGVTLKEPPQYKPSRPWDQLRPEKPWEVIE